MFVVHLINKQMATKSKKADSIQGIEKVKSASANVAKANENLISQKLQKLISDECKISDFAEISFSDAIKANSLMICKEKHFFPRNFEGKQKAWREKNRNELKAFCKFVLQGKLSEEGKNKLDMFTKFLICRYNIDLRKESLEFDYSKIFRNDKFAQDCKVIHGYILKTSK